MLGGYSPSSLFNCMMLELARMWWMFLEGASTSPSSKTSLKVTAACAILNEMWEEARGNRPQIRVERVEGSGRRRSKGPAVFVGEERELLKVSVEGLMRMECDPRRGGCYRGSQAMLG